MGVVARGQITIVAVNDGVSTYTKQVYMTSFVRPSTPSGASPSGWSESIPTAYKFENATDSSHNGYRVAKGNLANDFIKERLSFVVSSATSVSIQIEASSESGYDFIAVGDVDTDLDTRAKVTSLAAASKASGTDKKTVTRSLSAGTHYIDIVYSKDASGNYNSDCGWYKVKSVSGAVMTTLPNRLWVSVAKLTDGALDGSWSTPIPYDSVDGGNGENGADGYTVTTNPSNIIIEQDDDTNLDHFTLPLDVQFCAFKGGSVVSVTDVSIVGTPIGVTVAKKSGSTDTTTISAIAKINDKYQREYEYTARVSFDGVSRDVTVTVYVTFVATIKTDVQNGVEATVAQKLGFKAEGSNVYSIEAAGNFIRSAEEHTSQLDKYVKGRNLIPNVLTASGWSNVGVLDGGGIYRTGSAYARTPRFKVNKNTGHVLSFYEMVAKPLGQYVSITIYYYTDSSTTTEYSHTTTYSYQYTQVTDNNDTTYVRKYKTITTPDVLGTLYAEISISTISTAKPIFMLQLEEGSTPTPFDAETKDVGSIVKQTAENIEMKVGRCGLDIDEESITASGGKFKMQDDSGNTTFELDTNGNLTSKGDAAFSGTIRAKNFFHNCCIFLEGNGSANNEIYSYFKYYCFNGTTIDGVTYETGKYYDGALDVYPSNFAKCTYDADVVTMICNASPDGSTKWKTVLLPDPKDFEGKIVEVYGFNTGLNIGDHIVSCVTYLNGSTTYKFVKAIQYGSNGIKKEGSGKYTDTVAHDGMAKYLSIYANGDNEYYWLKLI